MPAGVSIVSVSTTSGGTCNAGVPGDSTQPTTCTFDSLSAGSMGDMQISVTVLPDTLGILNQEQTYEFCRVMLERYPELHIDFHAHNDYDLATANVYAALKAGITCVHTTVNGLGERAGNVPLSSVIAIVEDHFNFKMAVQESKLNLVSKIVESFFNPDSLLESSTFVGCSFS